LKLKAMPRLQIRLASTANHNAEGTQGRYAITHLMSLPWQQTQPSLARSPTLDVWRPIVRERHILSGKMALVNLYAVRMFAKAEWPCAEHRQTD
jgi:hypothetical protein